MSLERLDHIYNEMYERNMPTDPSNIKCDTNIDNSSERCYAIYSLGNWHLQPSWIRLNKYISEIIPVDIGTFYSVNPGSDQGKLHQTLLQFISFGSLDKYYKRKELINKSLDECYKIMKERGKYIEIIYRGLVWTKTGLALRGYPANTKDYDHIMDLRNNLEKTLKEKWYACDIPYKNDILHATFLRWKGFPSQEIIDQLNQTIHRWDECVFGELRISDWIIGKGSWKMLDNERDDRFIVRVPKIILHRGNNGVDTLKENDPATIEIRNKSGYSVECDIWCKDSKWFLGHDHPEFEIIDLDLFLLNKNNLIHAKDGETFSKLLKYCRERGLNNEIFYHTTEDYVLSTRGTIIAYPGRQLYDENLCMMPENMGRSITNIENAIIIGICSDNQSY